MPWRPVVRTSDVKRGDLVRNLGEGTYSDEDDSVQRVLPALTTGVVDGTRTYVIDVIFPVGVDGCWWAYGEEDVDKLEVWRAE